MIIIRRYRCFWRDLIKTNPTTCVWKSESMRIKFSICSKISVI